MIFNSVEEEVQLLQDRTDNLERELAAEVIKRERVEEFMRDRIMNIEEKLMDCQSALLICQKALVVFMSDQRHEADDKPKELIKGPLKVIGG